MLMTHSIPGSRRQALGLFDLLLTGCALAIHPKTLPGAGGLLGIMRERHGWMARPSSGEASAGKTVGRWC